MSSSSASAHCRARELITRGRVTGYVKRGKTDKSGAEAICEAVSRSSMRFVTVKTEALTVDTARALMKNRRKSGRQPPPDRKRALSPYKKASASRQRRALS
ncbi:hypothetical protein [Roseovarius sp. D22-M7]|uniref:hypothetical protein n=1 Tax=Roseovarius sp. D22-M7 TaxID=3127116 RepID=UPI003FA69632